MVSKLNAGSTASGLHYAGGMTVRIVGFVAVVALAGCGVGADESYAELGAGQSAQALEQAAPGSATDDGAPSAGTQPPETTSPTPGKDPGTVALPQDPIPVFVGQPMPQPIPGMSVDPGFQGPVPPPPSGNRR